MSRVRLQRDDGSFLESADLPEPLAGELAKRYFQAIHALGTGVPRPTVVIEGTGDTYGLPAAWLTGQIVDVSVTR
jgi:hypothetical protein